MGNCVPLELLQRLSQQYPGCWEKIEEIRKQNGTEEISWNEDCYISVSYTLQLIEAYASAQKDTNNTTNMNACALMAALAAWRQDKRIYRYPEGLAGKIARQARDEGISLDLLQQLPSYCVYIETPGWDHLGDPEGILGAFFHVESVRDYKQLIVNVIAQDGSCMPIGVDIVPDGTIRDGLEGLYKLVRRTRKGDDPTADIEAHYELVTGIVGVFLHFCSHGADFQPDQEQEQIFRAPKAPAFIKDKFREVRIWNYEGNG